MDKKWGRDNDNRIKGYVSAKAKDNDNVWHYDKLIVGFNAVPDKPIIHQIESENQSIELSFIAGGATGYKVYYDTDPGIPYNGTDADQGSSPIDVGNSNDITFTGLSNGITYYFSIKAYNDTGESNYSTELNAIPITTSGMLTQNETWPGNIFQQVVNITDNVTVGNGVTLTIAEGTTISIAQNKKIKVEQGGKIIANATFFPIKFIRANPDEMWDQIELIGDDNNFENCIFDGGTWNVHVSYGTGNMFKKCTFQNGLRGFYASGNVNKFTLDQCLFTENTDIGVYVKQCWGSMKYCEISGNDGPGLRLLAGKLGYYDPGYFVNNYIHNNDGYGIAIKGHLYMGYDDTPGNNLIRNNIAEEIRIENYFGSNYSQSNEGGLSDIYDENLGYYVKNLKPVTLSFINNYWGTASGPDGGPDRFSFYVDWLPCKYVSQSDAENNGAGAVAGLGKTLNGINKITLEELIILLITEISNNEYDSETAYKLLELYTLTEHPDIKQLQKFDIFSLINEKSEKYKDYKQKPDKYKHLSADEKSSLQLTGEIAMLAEVDMLGKEKQYDNALLKVKAIDKYITHAEHRRELLDLEVRILESHGQFKKAYNTLQKLKKYVESEQLTHYNMSDYELWEEDLLYEMGFNPYLNKQLPELFDDDNSYSIPTNFSLEQNYPNPFNPTTSISYDIPEPSRAIVKVYNMRGQCIAELADRLYQAGKHTVQFNANDLSTGIYFVRAQIIPVENRLNPYVFTIKMMLLK